MLESFQPYNQDIGLHSNQAMGWEWPLSPEQCLASPLSTSSCSETKGSTLWQWVSLASHLSNEQALTPCCKATCLFEYSEFPLIERELEAAPLMTPCTVAYKHIWALTRWDENGERDCVTYFVVQAQGKDENKAWRTKYKCLGFWRSLRWKRYPDILDAPLQKNNFIEIIQTCFNAFSAAEKKHATFLIAFAATEESVHFVKLV